MNLPAIYKLSIAELETRVLSGLKGFIEIGMLLIELKRRGEYIASHGTWEAYCEDIFKMTRQRGQQLITAVVVSTIVDVQNEGQARVLAGLPAAVMVKVMDRAKSHGDVTALALQEALVELVNEEEDAAGELAPGPIKPDWTPGDRLEAMKGHCRHILKSNDQTINLSHQIDAEARLLLATLERAESK